ncbi:MAG: hypothetical protein U0794_21415 [Isosphaeraceae bacterium]
MTKDPNFTGAEEIASVIRDRTPMAARVTSGDYHRVSSVDLSTVIGTAIFDTHGGVDRNEVVIATSELSSTWKTSARRLGQWFTGKTTPMYIPNDSDSVWALEPSYIRNADLDNNGNNLVLVGACDSM